MSSVNGNLSTAHAIIAALLIILFCTCSTLSIVGWAPAEFGSPLDVTSIMTSFDES